MKMSALDNIMSFDELLPNVVRSDGTTQTFDWSAISKNLQKETGMQKETAEEIAILVCRELLKFKLSYLTAPLIREVTCIVLLQGGYILERFKYTRVGMPVFELDLEESRWLKKWNDEDNLDVTIGEKVLEEYHKVKNAIYEIEQGENVT
jgi:anaerobic ribonucleoside-triphosphate reductase